MSKLALVLSVLLSSLSTLVFAAVAGQDIRASASVAYCSQTLLSATAKVSYLDNTGNSTQELPTAPARINVSAMRISVCIFLCSLISI